ncbi:histone-lysine N-methyltransferase ATX5 [Striga asiatica]|uniref:Histone-lysine N-methyltransferase ATX5 n=1 Tax=Striga asiatica TaxID=4170 RepID=A0A5A7QXM5_STRAF|nr:histone-lysine N-methyltransferase ATX5 [Striga asiatica]
MTADKKELVKRWMLLWQKTRIFAENAGLSPLLRSMQDYAWIQSGMIFPFIAYVNRFQGRLNLMITSPVIYVLYRRGIFGGKWFVEMLMVEINAAAGNLNYLRTLIRILTIKIRLLRHL